MTKINENYLKLPGSYLFSEIARRVAAYSAANPDKRLIKLGIGDVTRPLAPAVISAMHAAVDEMGTVEGFQTALQYMAEGDDWMVYIPAKLAYNEKSSNAIPAYSTLLYHLYIEKVISK